MTGVAMTLREAIVLENSPAEIWAILADPALMTLWNPKCVKCEPKGGPIRTGFRYKATFRLGGSDREADCEVVDFVPGELLKTRFEGGAFKDGGYVEETFRIVPSEAETKLVHEVDFSRSGLPWFVQALMKLIDTFGYSVGKSPLEGIRELVVEGARD
jgi:uncharacterized protein YndB with AHSA1/START domain